MKSVITFRYIGNDESIGHRDIGLEIPLFSIKKLVDSYWFIENDDFPIPDDKKSDLNLLVPFVLNTFLSNCISKLELLKKQEIFAIPLAVWDECAEYLVVENLEFDILTIRYGWSEKGGVNLFSLSQDHFFIDTVNFTHGPITIKTNQLIESLKYNIVAETD